MGLGKPLKEQMPHNKQRIIREHKTASLGLD